MNGVKTETSIKIDFEKAVYNAVWNAKNRITSYNVCYTKLLRYKKDYKPSWC